MVAQSLATAKVFLNQAQMSPESLQIDFEWACNFEQPHGRFNSAIRV
jgi:hypothetical protein